MLAPLVSFRTAAPRPGHVLYQSVQSRPGEAAPLFHPDVAGGRGRPRPEDRARGRTALRGQRPAVAGDALRLARGARRARLDRGAARRAPAARRREREEALLPDRARGAAGAPGRDRPAGRPREAGARAPQAAGGGERLSRGYRALLRLLPRGFRDKHGPEMEALFLAELQDARSRGPAAAAGAWLRAALDVVAESSRQAARRGERAPAKERQVLMAGSDLKHALRLLLRQRLATALVVGMLALGIAANVAVFSLVNGLFLRPFPFPDPERLVWINEKAPKWNLEVVGVNYPDFHQWRKEQRVFEGVALYDGAAFSVSDGKSAERISGLRVTHDFAAVLGVRPSLGRSFTPEEDRPRAERVVMIGQGLWQERFGGAPDVLGRSLKLNGVNHAVVGVLPAQAGFPGGVRLWVPFAGDPNQEYQSYGATAIGRLKPGVTLADADKDLLRTQQPIWEARDKERAVSPYARPLREVFVSDFRTAARTLSVAVALLLLVACANVASVML